MPIINDPGIPINVCIFADETLVIELAMCVLMILKGLNGIRGVLDQSGILGY